MATKFTGYNGDDYVAITIAQMNNGDKVTEIASSALIDKKNLKAITIPKTITTIGANAFGTSDTNGCTNLALAIYEGSLAEWCEVSATSSRSTPTYYAKDIIINGKLVTSIDTSVKKIAGCNFYRCKSLRTADLSEVTKIGAQAFNTCINLETVVLSKNLEEIPRYCFTGCTNLTEINIPAAVSTIGNYAFWGGN